MCERYRLIERYAKLESNGKKQQVSKAPSSLFRGMFIKYESLSACKSQPFNLEEFACLVPCIHFALYYCMCVSLCSKSSVSETSVSRTEEYPIGMLRLDTMENNDNLMVSQGNEAEGKPFFLLCIRLAVIGTACHVNGLLCTLQTLTHLRTYTQQTRAQ